MPPNRAPGPVVHGKLSTPCRRVRRQGKGHDGGGTTSRGGARGNRFGGSRGIGAVRIIRDRRCAAAAATAATSAVPLRDVLGRVHGDVRACRRDRLREPAEPGGGAGRTRWCRRSRRSGGSWPRGSWPGGSRAGRTGSPVGVAAPGTRGCRQRVLWLRTAPEPVTAATRQGRGSAFERVAGWLGDMFCPHK
jgi:hypothetical protein